jgi:hypothetical protein
MILNDRRLARMIARDPVPVAYTVGETEVETTGLLHRMPGKRGKDEKESAAGKVEQENLHVMLMASSIGGNIPVEGTMIVVRGENYRAGLVEASSDMTHYIVALLDPNG